MLGAIITVWAFLELTDDPFSNEELENMDEEELSELGYTKEEIDNLIY